VTRALLALLLAATAATASGVQPRDPLQALDECVTRLDNELDVGYARIAARCPQLASTLGESAFAPWLPADWKRPDNELSAAGLSELRAQLAREGSPRAPEHVAPHSERVTEVLATLARSEQDAGRSWWRRLKDWLRGLISARPQAEQGWLRRWWAQLKLSTSTTELFGWAALAVVVALAAGIIINELRIAGLLRRGPERLRTRPAHPASNATASLADIERAAPEEQPALLLELIAARLADQQRLPPARALTARELARAARLPAESARVTLAELAAVCERVRYSAERVTAASLAAAVRSGSSLFAMLESAPPGAAAETQ
jgi:hypothetical protein